MYWYPRATNDVVHGTDVGRAKYDWQEEEDVRLRRTSRGRVRYVVFDVCLLYGPFDVGKERKKGNDDF